MYSSSRATGRRNAASLADAKADARRLIERLGGQVLNLTGTDDASKQAMADASERYTAASSQIDQATTAKQAMLAKESAIEGLYYVRAARVAMGMDPGPELETLSGQKSAGTVTEDRRVEFEGREIEASPTPIAAHPELLPRRSRRRPAGARRLVLRTVVEAGTGGRRVGYRVGAAVRRDVLRHARRRTTARRASSRATATVMTRASTRVCKPGRMAATVAAATAAGTAAASAAAAAGGGGGGGWAGGGGGDFGGGDFGGGDFGGFDF